MFGKWDGRKKGRETSYHYDALNRLMFTEEGPLEHLLAGMSSSQADGFDGNVAAMEETGGRSARGRTAGGRTRPAYGTAEGRRR